MILDFWRVCVAQGAQICREGQDHGGPCRQELRSYIIYVDGWGASEVLSRLELYGHASLY